MNAIKRYVSVPGLLLAVLAIVVISLQATGQNAATAKPTVVVTVDLRAVLNELDQRASAEAALRRMAEEIREEDQRRSTELETLETQLREIPETDREARRAAEAEFAKLALDYKAWVRFATEKMDIEQSLMMRDLHRSVKAAVAQLCQVMGYQIVLIDDSKQEIVVNPESSIAREAQVRQQMISRRILYADETVDITEELIKRMNNAFNAGG